MAPRDPLLKSDLFERAIGRILKPLARALIAQGVTAPAFYRMIKQTYIEAAEEELGTGATDSRISVVTGVHRRDVKELRKNDKTEDHGLTKKVSILSTVIGRWMSDPAFCDDAGAPVPLPRSGASEPSFDALVQSVSRDIRPRTVLDELTRQNIVETRDGDIHLLLEGLVGSADLDQKLHFFSLNVGDHVRASVENLLADTSPNLERAVYYNRLSETSMDEIDAEVRKISLDALRKINTLASNKQSADKTNATASHRFRFGVFLYKEDEGVEEKGPNSDDDQ